MAGQGGLRKALPDLNEAIRFEPKLAAAYTARVQVWLHKQDYDRALADCDVLIRLAPQDADIRAGRGVVCCLKGDQQQAAADLDEAIRLNPRCPRAHSNRAWFWSNCPDPQYRNGQKAVEAAKRACELTDWKDGGYLANLAEACAAAGRIADSLRYQKQAEECSRVSRAGADPASPSRARSAAE